MKIIIEIELGNEEMQTGFDAVYALCGENAPRYRSPLFHLMGHDSVEAGEVSQVFDINGNRVGKIEVVA